MTQQPSLFPFGVESRLHPVKNEETPADIRELYEQTKREAQAQSSLSTMRNGTTHTRSTRVVSGETSGGRATRSASVESVIEAPSANALQLPEGMDVDIPEEIEEVEEDFVQRTLKNAAKARREGKTQATQSAGIAASGRADVGRARSPSEVPEELEDYPTKRPRRDSPVRPTRDGKNMAGSEGPTKDEAFLEAISQSVKAKKALDELDQEFNQLRIPKRTAPGRPDGSTVTRANEWEHPDYYRILQDFDGDDMRGNFIQIVKKDMFRKDGGTKVADRTAAVADDGRPNFKKFKKASSGKILCGWS